MANNRKPFVVSEKIEDLVNEPNELSSSLLDMPSEITQYMGSWLDTKARSATAKTCKAFNNFFQPNIDKESEPFVASALKYAANGQMKELNALLTKRPGLVYKRGKTLDPCGRIVHGSVYRIALGAKDWNPFPEKNFEEMVEMIERHMKRLPKGEEEIELQKAEQFPDGWEEQERIREANDSAALKKVFTAIDQSTTDEDCKDAIEEFINYLKSQNEVKTGYHYNDQLLSEAQDLYDANYDKFGGFDSRKNRLAAIRVIGNIQGRMTSCLAMAHCHGLATVTEEKKQLRRRMDLNDGTPFFSPNLGSSHFVYSYYGDLGERVCAGAVSGALCCGRGDGVSRITVGFYKTYVEQKRQVASNGKILHLSN